MPKYMIYILFVVCLLGLYEQRTQITFLQSLNLKTSSLLIDVYTDKILDKNDFDDKIKIINQNLDLSTTFVSKSLKNRRVSIISDFDFDTTSLEYKTNLLRAYQIGSEHGLGLVAVGVCLQETLCGRTTLVGHMSAEIGKRSYGLMQLKVVAVIDVLNAYPHLGDFNSEEEIIAKLLTDHDWNILISIHYMKILKNMGLTDREMLTAYNLGPTGAKNIAEPEYYKYTNKVIKHIEKYKEFVEKYG